MSMCLSSEPLVYQCTSKALDLLQRRDQSIPVRWRQILLLLRHKSQQFGALKQAVLDPQHIQSMMAAGLIEPAVLSSAAATVWSPPDPVPVAEPSVQPVAVPVADPAAVLSMEGVRQQMLDSLQQGCGLLAAGLAAEIRQAHDLSALRRCLPRWKTSLLDSRMARGLRLACIDQVTVQLAALQAG